MDSQNSKESFEWLTKEICKEYMSRAAALSDNNGQDAGEWRKLREELQNRCHITELEAINILHGYHIDSYVYEYAVLSGKIQPLNVKKKAKTSEEKYEKEAGKKRKKKDDAEERIEQYKEQIASLQKRLDNADFDFEERD